MDVHVAASELLKVCGHPVRLQILEVLLRDREACVCHLEANLGQRQAAISQHLARLRRAGLVVDRRDGWNVYYSVAEPSLGRLLTTTRAAVEAITKRSGRSRASHSPRARSGEDCPCPRCNPAASVAAAC